MTLNARFQIPRSITIGDIPENGVLEEGELFVNLFDQRIWVYDQFRFPQELGGSVKSFPVGENHNHQSLDMTSYWDVNTLITIPNPANILNSETYSEHYLFLNNIDKITPTLISTNLSIKFLYPIRWASSYQGEISSFNNSTGEIQIDTTNTDYPRSVLIKLFTYGPSSFWRGLILAEWTD